MNQNFLCIPVILLIICIKKTVNTKQQYDLKRVTWMRGIFFKKLNNYDPKVFLSHQCDSTNEITLL